MSQPTESELAAWLIVSSIIKRLALPEDLRGCTVGMPEFADGETCAHFYPGRTLGFHRTVNALLAGEVRSRGGRCVRAVMTRSGTGGVGAETTRRALAERHYSVSAGFNS